MRSKPLCARSKSLTQSAYPIPRNERELPTVVAEPYYKVSDQGLQLEGASFDRQGNLFFVDVFGGTIFRLTSDKQLSTLPAPNKLGPAGMAIHKNGRLYVAGLGNFFGSIQTDRSSLRPYLRVPATWLMTSSLIATGDSTSLTSRGLQPILSAAFITYPLTARRSPPSCRTWPWPMVFA
jgi:hypothetical protein